jgi:hypothetical protein
MIRLFILLVIFVAIISSVLHVSAGWAWIIALSLIVGIIVYKTAKPGGTQYVKTSAMWKCPYCLKRSKLGATACHHCGRSLVEPRVQPPPA